MQKIATNVNPTTISIKNILWICIGLFVLTVVAFIIIRSRFPEKQWLISLIGAIGSIASLCGVIIALFQIQQSNRQIQNVETVSIAIAQAVAQNREEIRNILMFSDIGHLCERIITAQNHILKNEIQIALLLMKNIKDDMTKLHFHLRDIFLKKESSLETHIQKINSDINTLAKYIIKTDLTLSAQQESPYDSSKIHKNLEEARNAINQIEGIIKSSKL